MRLSHQRIVAVGAKVSITFNGERLGAFEGETIAAALAANGITALRHSPNGEPRGLYCGMGSCFDCLVTVNGRLSQRACLTQVVDGQNVKSVDLTAARIDDFESLAPTPLTSQPESFQPDILVVGAGPAGLSAACAAAQAGASVTVLDERPAPGGQFFKQQASSHHVITARDRQFEAGRKLINEAKAAGVVIAQDVTVLGAFSPDEISAVLRDRQVVYHPKKLILATGAYERAAPFPGWTIPGVMTTGAAQTLVRTYRVAPGRKILIAGNGPLNLQLACELLESGVEVSAVLEAAKSPGVSQLRSVLGLLRAPDLVSDGLRYLRTLKKHGVPLLYSHAVVEAEGRDRVKAIRYGPLKADGRVSTDDLRTIEVDTVCVGYGFLPSSEVARALGCKHHFVDRHIGYNAISTKKDGSTNIDGVYAIGDGADPLGAHVAVVQGRLAGMSAAASLGLSVSKVAAHQAAVRLKTALAFQSSLWRIFQPPPVNLRSMEGATTLCRCEEISFLQIGQAIERGFDRIATLRRECRLGMGLCQGRYCIPLTARLLRELDRPETEANLTPRVPAKPVPAAALAYEKPEWGGHRRTCTPNLASPTDVVRLPDRTVDVVIIGAGVMGACLAYYLSRAGKQVLVVDRDDANLQASGGNAGSLHVQLLSYDFGDQAYAGGGPAASTLPLGPRSVDLWRELEKACHQDFELAITGGLMVADSDRGLQFLRAKAALEQRHGIENAILSAHELRTLAPALSDRLIGAEYAPQEGKINPLRATYALLDKAKQQGAEFLRGANVTAIERVGSHWQLTTSRCRIGAAKVVNAGGPWAREIAALVDVDLPVHSAPLQMIVTERAPPLVTQLVAHANRHLSLKQAATGGIVIGGAWPAQFAASHSLNRVTRESLEGNVWVATSVLPHINKLHVIRAWAAMNVDIDGAPIFGEVPGRRGFFNAVTSSGYTLAPAVAWLSSQLITEGRADMDTSPFSIERF